MVRRWIGGLVVVVAVSVAAGVVGAQSSAPPDAIKRGSAIYEQNCAPCHGPGMQDPQGAFDLRTFPKDDRARFITSVSKGKNAMPPWGGVFSADEIEALWMYVSTAK